MRYPNGAVNGIRAATLRPGEGGINELGAYFRRPAISRNKQIAGGGPKPAFLYAKREGVHQSEFVVCHGEPAILISMRADPSVSQPSTRSDDDIGRRIQITS